MVVHPIDAAAHPTVGAAWRWGIQIGGKPPGDMTWCAQAGAAPTREEAMDTARMYAATAVQTARMFGVPAELGAVVLDHDPVPAGADFIHVV